MNARTLLRRFALAFAAALAVFAAPLMAQETYPSRTVRIVIGFAPGSGTDLAARMIAEELSKTFSQPFIVENKPGAAVQVAANYVKAAPADGYTLLLTSNSSHSVNPHIFKKLAYDPIADFTPIGGIGVLPFIVAVDANIPVRSLKELATYAAANRGKVFYAYSGTVFRVPAEALNKAQKLEATGVPYKSSPDAMTDVIGGREQFLVVDLASSQALVNSGRLRVLAVTGAKRSALAPDLPSVEEVLGVRDFDMAAWTGLFGPAGLPKDVVDKLSGALLKILTRPDMRERMLASNIEPMPLDPAAFEAMVKQQLDAWGVKVKDAGIEPE